MDFTMGNLASLPNAFTKPVASSTVGTASTMAANVAIGKVATQSSTAHGLSAHLAIDGSVNDDFDRCATTKLERHGAAVRLSRSLVCIPVYFCFFSIERTLYGVVMHGSYVFIVSTLTKHPYFSN